MTNSGVVKKSTGVIKHLGSSFPPPPQALHMLSPRSPPHVPTPAPQGLRRDQAFLPCLPCSSWFLRGVQAGPCSLKAVPAPVWVPRGCLCPPLRQPPPQPGAMPRSGRPAAPRRPLPGRAAPRPRVVRGLFFFFPPLLLILMINRSIGRVSIFLTEPFKRNRSDG